MVPYTSPSRSCFRSIPSGAQLGKNAQPASGVWQCCSTKSGLFVLDGHVTSRCALVLASNEVGDLFILGLLDRALVALISGAHELLLNEVDTCVVEAS